MYSYFLLTKEVSGPVIFRYQLRIGDTRNDVNYLGYPLTLTPTEYRILRLLSEQTDGVPAEELLVGRNGKAGKAATIAVHICSINRKAAVIGERKIILFENGCYRLNPYM